MTAGKPDDLVTLFTRFRTEEVRQVLPPGTAAARRTVRRRRVTTAVSTAAAILAIAGGSAVLLSDRSRPEPPPPAASAPSSPEARATAALGKLVADDAGLPGIDVRSPVVDGFQHTERVYATPVQVTAACIGTGTITLAVTGKDAELSRMLVPCGAEPVPVRRDVDLNGPDLVFRLADIRSAAQSGFAFRITAAPGSPHAPGTVADDDLAVLVGLVGGAGVREGGTMPLTEPGERFRPNGSYAKARHPAKPATLTLICRAAAGELTLQFRRTATTPDPDESAGPTGKLLAEHTVPCAAKPAAEEFLIRESLTTNIATWYRYDAPAGQEAEWAYSVSFR
ncbi:hypothetical protein [Actinoplanes sp. CA-252034]|uniref:hypothetical protein n=1 Tax=Actinoplanes sp. CA-252034 TaxID=3239906 RepID=UPI003D965CB8